MEYKENLRKIAQEIGMDVYNGNPYTLLEWNTVCLRAARITVKHMMNAVQKSWLNGEPLSEGHFKEFLKYAIKEGLIPEQEAGKI